VVVVLGVEGLLGIAEVEEAVASAVVVVASAVVVVVLGVEGVPGIAEVDDVASRPVRVVALSEAPPNGPPPPRPGPKPGPPGDVESEEPPG
jgi:hypothetical protein